MPLQGRGDKDSAHVSGEGGAVAGFAAIQVRDIMIMTGFHSMKNVIVWLMNLIRNKDHAL